MTRSSSRQKQIMVPDMVTGFMKLNGTTVGAVANRTAVFGDDGEIS